MRTEGRVDYLRFGIEVPHSRHLGTLLSVVILINADKVNPNGRVFLVVMSLLESIPAILANFELHVVNTDLCKLLDHPTCTI